MNMTDWIQAISASVAVIVTIVLARITYVYARETKRMAGAIKAQTDMQKKEFELRMTPLIEEKFFMKTTGVIDPTVEVTVTNIGYYPVKFSHIFYKLNDTQNPDNLSGDVFEINKWLEKGISTTKEMTFDFRKKAAFKTAKDIKNRGHAFVKLAFIDINNKQFFIEKSFIY